ncbi:MAG: AAA family ATPase [Actinomycetota bacterium]|nr:AAA family ATPase [Actinomycetota bacterium]
MVDWAEVFTRPPVDAIVDGLLIPGRWTALVAPAKAGKSTLALHIAHTLARGIDPFTGVRRAPVTVLYIDGEMGELDVHERVVALDLTPTDLVRLHYTDRPPKGDTAPGGIAVESTVRALGVEVVILDGLNALISGAENDDLPWRNLYELTIAPLKSAGCAVLSSDNTGHVETHRGRGSSVKLDKADAVTEVKRTDSGVRLLTPRPRCAAYAREIVLAIDGAEGDRPITYRHALHSWPDGTHTAVALLDRLGVPRNAGRPAALAALKAAGEGVRTEVLAAAIRYRKSAGTPPGTPPPEQLEGTAE